MIAVFVLIVIGCLGHGKKYESVMIGILSIAFLAGVIYFTMIKGGRTELTGVSIKLPMPFWKAIQRHRYGLTTNRSALKVILFIPNGYKFSRVIMLKRGKKTP